MKVPSHRLAALAATTLACVLSLGWPGATHRAAAQSPPEGASFDHAAWAVDPSVPGPDLPPAGRSLFDHLITEPAAGALTYRIPFPFSALIERVRGQLTNREFSGGTRIVIIPMGRSLQRLAAAPDFFDSPRVVFAVTGEPRTDAADGGMLLKDRVYVGYVKKTATLEVISYNESAGRFEFQLVKDYRAGAQPKVFYANRAICIACHQNHAPIFSRPIWGETNANGRVAALLRAHGTDRQLSAQANIDFPDDVDKATARANLLVPLQTVWQDGCAAGDERTRSRRCRAAALTAVLQYGLSGKQDFDSRSAQYRDDLVATLARAWAQRWPQGLWVGESALPDRTPLGGTVSSYGSGSAGETAADWIAAANVAADLDPLNPRPPHEIWRFTGGMDLDRLISGWASFFAADDFRALDAHLREQGERNGLERTVYRAPCTLTRAASAGSDSRLECASGVATSQGANLAARFDEKGGGHIAWMNLGPGGRARDVRLSAGEVRVVGAQYVLRAIPRQHDLAARLPDGRAIARIEVRWPAAAKRAEPVAAQLDATVIDDFALVRRAIDSMLAQQPALFDDAPLMRARLLQALFSQLDMPPRGWCCSDTADMPPAQVDTPEVNVGAIGERALHPFYRYCARCHMTQERFPPNFLSGTASEVAEKLRACAPRMLVRLSAWRTPADQRAKSPMPPATALPGLGATPRQWADSRELEQLRAYVERLVRRDAPTAPALPPEGYEALPQCLPSASH